MLNNLTINQSIEILISLRDKIIRENGKTDKSLEAKWLEPDALEQVINFVEENYNEKENS